MGSELSKNKDESEGEDKMAVEVEGSSSTGLEQGLPFTERDCSNVESHSSTQSDSDEFTSTSTSTATTSLPKPFKQSHEWNAKFLLGNLENLPTSARKLFSIGMLYLNNDKNREREAGYSALFQTLPSGHTDTEEDLSNSNSGSCSNSSPTNCDLEEHENPIRKNLADGVKKISNLFVPMQNSSPLNCTQTYVQWRAAHDLLNMYSFCLPTRNVIYLQPIDLFPDFVQSFSFPTNMMNLTFFEMLQGFTQIFFSGMEVVIQPRIFVNEMGWNVRSRLHEVTNQRQYCVTDMYPCLQKILPRGARCIVGITWTDLFPEGFNFVLGEASDTHKSAVVSFGRFEPSRYNADTHCDVSEVNGQLVWKLLKTLSHEVCHIFGFSHCSFFLCAMNESSSVSDALSQPLFLCPVCLRKLQRVCGFDILDRYRHLRKFLSSLDYQLGDSSCLKDSILWLDTCIHYLTTTAT